MNPSTPVLSRTALLTFALLLSVASPVAAASHDPMNMGATEAPAADSQKTWLTAAKAAYPLKTCVISGDKLEEGGTMGDPIDYVYKEEGKPDRLVRFCCKSCVKTFKKDPAKYLKLINEAAAASAK